MNEIEVVVSQQNGIVDFNFEQIKEQLTAEMELYKSLVFTEEQKPAAKKDIANLRKLKTAIDTKRKEVKKTFMEPYDSFEKQVKELISLIDEPIALIDKQVAEFEEKQRTEKVHKINEMFAEIEHYDFITLESIYKKEWENISVSLKSIKSDMEEKIFHIKQDLNTIEAFNSEAGEKAKNTYLNNGFNITPCIQYIQQYEAQKKEFEEKERIRREQERLVEEQRKHDEEIARIEREKAEEIAKMESEKEIENIPDQEPQGFNFDEEPQGFSFPTKREITIKFSVEEECLEDTFKMLKNILGNYEVLKNEI